MYYVIALFAAALTAGYGNAMRKVTWRRRLAAGRGEQTAGTTRVYDVTGLLVMGLGLAGLGLWLAWVAVGNPVALFADRLG